MKATRLLFLVLCIPVFVFAQNARTTVTLDQKNYSYASLTDQEVIIPGKTDLHITASTCKAALNNSIVRLNSVDSWLFFDNIQPSVVIDSLLQYVYADSAIAKNASNVRVAIYKNGTVVMAHPAGFQPLTFYSGKSFTGDSAKYSISTYYNNLGTMDNQMRSFKLKRGYMATLATANDGSGYSRVFIADKQDLDIDSLNYLLDQVVSFVRVFKWDYVSKKGWAGYGATDLSLMKPTWRYDWSASGNTTSDIEYVPIEQNLGWPSFTDINAKTNVTHLLGYNEPSHTDQANISVEQAVAAWPQFMKSGLRLGSPACTSNSWLFSFLDECKALNLRVDYVVIHAYWGGMSPQSWYNNLKWIHDQSGGLPLWITEWNNGANWTTESWPTADRSYSAANAQKQLDDLKGILTVLDTTSFVERYSIYNWVQDCRAMTLNGQATLAGQYYSDDKSEIAFNRKYEVIPTFTLDMNPSLTTSFSSNKIMLNISDNNGEYDRGFILEKKTGTSDYQQIYETNNKSEKSYIDTLDTSNGNIRYRVKVKLVNGNTSNYSPAVGIDVATGSDVEFGSIDVANLDFNSVFYAQPFDNIPSIVAGAPSNSNFSLYMTTMVRFINKTQRFSLSIAPWQYQDIPSSLNAESIPYLVMSSGSHNLGGLQADAGSASVGASWVNITFDSAFSEVPVVFADQLLAGGVFPTVVRIKDVTTTGFKAKIMKEDDVTSTIVPGTVSFVAIQPGTGNINGHEISVGKTTNAPLASTPVKVVFGTTFANPIFLAQLQSCNDDNETAALRVLAKTDTQAYVSKQRDKSVTTSITASDDAGWILIDPVKTTDAVTVNKVSDVSFYPSQVQNVIHIQSDQPVGVVSVYNTEGILLKQTIPVSNTIEVGDLAPGCYLIKTQNSTMHRFIKL